MDVLLISGGLVTNCIHADSVERALQFNPGLMCIERTTDIEFVCPGYTYDGSVFTAPPVITVPPAPISKLDLLRRFTAAQRIAIRASTDPVIIDAMQLMDLADYISLIDPDTVNLVAYLEATGFINAADAANILGG